MVEQKKLVDKEEMENQKKGATIDIAKVEEQLAESDSPFIKGEVPSKVDHDTFEVIKQKPPTSKHPQCFAWYSLIQGFHEGIRQSWGPPEGVKKVAENAKKESQTMKQYKNLQKTLTTLEKAIADGTIKVKNTKEVQQEKTELQPIMVCVGPSTKDKVDQITSKFKLY